MVENPGKKTFYAIYENPTTEYTFFDKSIYDAVVENKTYTFEVQNKGNYKNIVRMLDDVKTPPLALVESAVATVNKPKPDFIKIGYHLRALELAVEFYKGRNVEVGLVLSTASLFEMFLGGEV